CSRGDAQKVITVRSVIVHDDGYIAAASRGQATCSKDRERCASGGDRKRNLARPVAGSCRNIDGSGGGSHFIEGRLHVGRGAGGGGYGLGLRFGTDKSAQQN